MAQYTSAEDLSEALLSAKDIITEGKIPLILLDEFDSKFGDGDYGWFKHLLSLLQDGTFKSGNSLYHLGKSIVVCVGGVHNTFEEFDKSHSDNKEEREKFKNAKGPDLVSRLRGCINIKGPNLQKDDDDNLYRVRRAVITALEKKNYKKSGTF